jgi:hypothetical protein
MNKTDEELNLAEALENDAKEHREVSYGLDCPPERTANWKHALNCEAAARLIREALAEQSKCACDSPAWCTKYKKCNREVLGLPKAQPVKQEPVGELVLVHRKVLNKLGIDDEVINTVAHTPAQQEPVATEHPLVAYAESYEQIARSGSYGKVFALAVATDIRQNMIPLTAANVDLSVLRPRNWTREMSDAWHRAIPNLEKAFDDLIAAYKEKNK